jgi:tRNA (cmo5U34)-methyltransferase
MILADLIEPAGARGRSLHAENWDRATRERSESIDRPKLFQRFEAEHWNYYRYPDPMDRPSSLFDQLTWLKNAGFESVDCFWLYAGHAVYGGLKSPASAYSVSGISFEEALGFVKRAIAERESADLSGAES